MKNGKREDKTNENDDKENLASEDETEDGRSSSTNHDQDSDISFMNETDEEIDTAAIEEEWIDYMKRSTDEAIEQMKKNTDTRCWVKTHKRMKWRLTLRIASLPGESWIVKAGQWNPEPQFKIQNLQSSWKTKKKMGR